MNENLKRLWTEFADANHAAIERAEAASELPAPEPAGPVGSLSTGDLLGLRHSMPTPLEMLIDKACGVNEPPPPRKLTAEEKEACAQLGRDVLSDLRFAYPDVVKTRPTTWPVHLRNTIAIKAEAMLRDALEEQPCAARLRDMASDAQNSFRIQGKPVPEEVKNLLGAILANHTIGLTEK